MLPSNSRLHSDICTIKALIYIINSNNDFLKPWYVQKPFFYYRLVIIKNKNNGKMMYLKKVKKQKISSP